MLSSRSSSKAGMMHFRSSKLELLVRFPVITDGVSLLELDILALQEIKEFQNFQPPAMPRHQSTIKAVETKFLGGTRLSLLGKRQCLIEAAEPHQRPPQCGLVEWARAPQFQGLSQFGLRLIRPPGHQVEPPQRAMKRGRHGPLLNSGSHVGNRCVEIAFLSALDGSLDRVEPPNESDQKEAHRSRRDRDAQKRSSGRHTLPLWRLALTWRFARNQCINAISYHDRHEGLVQLTVGD
jgi:hypothetical protein